VHWDHCCAKRSRAGERRLVLLYDLHKLAEFSGRFGLSDVQLGAALPEGIPPFFFWLSAISYWLSAVCSSEGSVALVVRRSESTQHNRVTRAKSQEPAAAN